MLGLLAYLSYKMPLTGGIVAFFYNPGLMLIFAFFVTSYIVAVLLRMISSKNFSVSDKKILIRRINDIKN